ncbi:YgaP-like transmembrane domain [Kaarinaea lacus]
MNTTTNNICIMSRTARMIIGLLLVIGVSFNPGMLGAAVALPLIGIYPLMTGAWGWDPLVAIYELVKTNTSAAVSYTRIPAAT